MDDKHVWRACEVTDRLTIAEYKVQVGAARAKKDGIAEEDALSDPEAKEVLTVKFCGDEDEGRDSRLRLGRFQVLYCTPEEGHEDWSNLGKRQVSVGGAEEWTEGCHATL